MIARYMTPAERADMERQTRSVDAEFDALLRSHALANKLENAMKAEYLPTTPEGRIWRLIEEMGEVLQALGKAGRFGIDSRHPNGGPSNIEQLATELVDVSHAVAAVANDIQDYHNGVFDDGHEAQASQTRELQSDALPKGYQGRNPVDHGGQEIVGRP